MSSNQVQQEATPVKMFFSSSEIKEKVVPKDDVSTAYIIFQNNELHTKLENVKNDLIEVTTEKDELENEVDSLTKTRTCLQGYVKNEHIIGSNWKKIAMCYHSVLKKYNKNMNIQYLVNIIFVLLISSIINYELRISIAIIYSTSNIYVNYKRGIELNKQWLQNVDILGYQTEIKNLDKSNSYIDELIDNM